MKEIEIINTADVLTKIETIEREVMDLKLIVLKKLTPTCQKAISLKGILKGVKITSRDIATAKRALYSKIKV